MAFSGESERYEKFFRFGGRIMTQSALPRKFSKLKNTKSVPQTDTGVQVE